jgi:ribonuclease HI
MNNVFHVFTDGSAVRNPGPGGWAAILIHGGKTWELSGSSPWTTISEMELLAAVMALRAIPAGSIVELRSDSELLIQGMSFRLLRWQSRGWRNSRGRELQYQQWWSELLRLSTQLRIRWHWIKGHSGHPIQTRADALASQAARTLSISLRRAA